MKNKRDWGSALLYLVTAAVLLALLTDVGSRDVTPHRQEQEQAKQTQAPAVAVNEGGEPGKKSADPAVNSNSPEPESAPALPKEPDPDPPPSKAPNVAIVLDDCGSNIRLARDVLALDLPLTWAILPGRTHSVRIAKMLDDARVPYLVHVPMQAEADPDGKAGAEGMYDIGVGMSASAVTEALSALLDSLPGAYGINNHRGSRATADEDTMGAVMDELARRGLFFLDSSTSARTVAYAAAKAKGLRALKNRYFLDNEAERGKIAEEMKSAIKMAKKRGDTVVICHLRPETAAFLTDLGRWNLPAMGVSLVTLPQLVEMQGERAFTEARRGVGDEGGAADARGGPDADRRY